MNGDSAWAAAGDDALAWIREIGASVAGVGFIVGPMPDQAYVLHPIFERVDGKPVQLSSSDGTPDLNQPDEDQAPLRRVTWADYAARRGVPMIPIGTYPTWSMPLASQFDAANHDQDVWPPSEGNLDDPSTRQAVFDILTEHTTAGGAALITVLHQALGPTRVDSDILRGPLNAWPELFTDDQVYSPQNIWPDTHEWVLNTDPDMWATAISGPPDLIEALLRSPHLETVRLHPFI